MGGHSYAEGADEFLPGDAAVLVGVEVVVDGAQFLGGEEDAQFGEQLLELELAEPRVAVLVEGLGKLAGGDFEKLQLLIGPIKMVKRPETARGEGWPLTVKTCLSWAMLSMPFALSWNLNLLVICSMRFLQSAMLFLSV